MLAAEDDSAFSHRDAKYLFHLNHNSEPSRLVVEPSRHAGEPALI